MCVSTDVNHDTVWAKRQSLARISRLVSFLIFLESRNGLLSALHQTSQASLNLTRFFRRFFRRFFPSTRLISLPDFIEPCPHSSPWSPAQPAPLHTCRISLHTPNYGPPPDPPLRNGPRAPPARVDRRSGLTFPLSRLSHHHLSLRLRRHFPVLLLHLLCRVSPRAPHRRAARHSPRRAADPQRRDGGEPGVDGGTPRRGDDLGGRGV